MNFNRIKKRTSGKGRPFFLVLPSFIARILVRNMVKWSIEFFSTNVITGRTDGTDKYIDRWGFAL